MKISHTGSRENNRGNYEDPSARTRLDEVLSAIDIGLRTFNVQFGFDKPTVSVLPPLDSFISRGNNLNDQAS